MVFGGDLQGSFVGSIEMSANHYIDNHLTDEEKKAIASLKSLAKKWPDSLWLYAADGGLWVMKKDGYGRHAINASGGVDPDYAIEIVRLEADGGDW